MSSEEELNELFVEFVVMQAQQASLFLGKFPPAEGQEPMVNLEVAKRLIDQIEMLQQKTRGNLTPQEEQFLGSVLSDLRLAFVEAANRPATPAPAAGGTPSPAPEPSGVAEPKPETPDQPAKAEPAESESRKRFTKSYG